MGNPGNSGGGSICRDDRGGFLFAFASAYGVGSNVNAELKAIYDGMEKCLASGLLRVVVESDSQLVVNFLSGSLSPGWKWGYWIARINRLKCRGQFLFRHIFREGKGAVDAMARLGSRDQTTMMMSSRADLPARVRGLLFLDMVGLSSLKESARVVRG
ncbi:uncharacterized protein LOC131255033 [Magnolia sinica]|uniref:uncharacterized protein LOC131255033 n=1 Tax=Magnolia sinica TaxID=86752 RepID=UPI0026588704|nr:uncharacterized protein LOC131255033 [Magnolia sinica]